MTPATILRWLLIQSPQSCPAYRSTPLLRTPPIGDQFWGDRAGAVADPAGSTWSIASRKEDLTEAEIKERAADFFKAATRHQSEPT